MFRRFSIINIYLTCISDFATDDVCVTVFVQWSENLVRTSPNNWNFPVLCAEFAWPDISDDLLVNVVRFEIRGILFVAVDGYKEAWFLKKVPDPSFGMLSTTRVNSVNCFVKNGVWSPWKYRNQIDYNNLAHLGNMFYIIFIWYIWKISRHILLNEVIGFMTLSLRLHWCLMLQKFAWLWGRKYLF